MLLSSDVLFLIAKRLKSEQDRVSFFTINHATRSLSSKIPFKKLVLLRHHQLAPLKVYHFDKVYYVEIIDISNFETNIITPNEIIIKCFSSRLTTKFLHKYFRCVKNIRFKCNINSMSATIDFFEHFYDFDLLEIGLNEISCGISLKTTNKSPYYVHVKDLHLNSKTKIIYNNVNFTLSTKLIYHRVQLNDSDSDLKHIPLYTCVPISSPETLSVKKLIKYPLLENILVEMEHITEDQKEILKKSKVKHISLNIGETDKNICGFLPETTETLSLYNYCSKEKEIRLLEKFKHLKELKIYQKQESPLKLVLDFDLEKLFIFRGNKFSIELSKNVEIKFITIYVSDDFTLPELPKTLEGFELFIDKYDQSILLPEKLKSLSLSFGVKFPRNIKYVEKLRLTNIEGDISQQNFYKLSQSILSLTYLSFLSKPQKLPSDIKITMKKCEVIINSSSVSCDFDDITSFLKNQDIESLFLCILGLSEENVITEEFKKINIKKLKLYIQNIPFNPIIPLLPTTIQSFKATVLVFDELLDLSPLINLKKIEITIKYIHFGQNNPSPVFIRNIPGGIISIKIKNPSNNQLGKNDNTLKRLPRSIRFGKLPSTLKHLYIFNETNGVEFEEGIPSGCRFKIIKSDSL